MNHPNLHFEMNEAWILDPDAGLTAHEATPVRELRHEELYPDGSLKGTWGGRVLDDGRFVLDGEQTWYWENGSRQYAVTYDLGRKTGEETHWTEEGVRDWTRDHGEDASSTWRQWWPNGQKKIESHWKHNRCVGTATHWDRDGQVVGRWEFEEGALQGPEGEFILSDMR
jgi:antitoxin component YwqK of YwqJK toxin-antitoxin module